MAGEGDEKQGQAQHERSWTEPITNLLFLHQIDLREHLPIVLDRQFPEECLPAFLHELTHHWCFQGPVGATLTLLNLRARNCAYFDKDRPGILRNLSRAQVASELLRPMAEGLALFAEFDLEPSNSGLVSGQLESFLRFFLCSDELFNRMNAASTREDKQRIFLDQSRRVLRSTRLSPAYRARKLDLFCRPLDCTDGGYLIGYFAVKRLWRQASRVCEDRSLVLAFLRAYIYEDFGFVDALLTTMDSAIEEAETINRYFQERIVTLFRLMDDERRFERVLADYQEATRVYAERIISIYKRAKPSEKPALSSRSGGFHLDFFPINLTDPDKANAGRNAFQQLWEDCFPPYRNETNDEFGLEDGRHLFERRSLIFLSTLAGRVEVNDTGLVSFSCDDQPLMACRALTPTKSGSDDGALELVYDPQCAALLLAVTRGYHTVAVDLLSEIPDWRREKLLQLNYSRENIYALDGPTGLHADLVERVAGKEILDGLGWLRRSTQEASYHFYSHLIEISNPTNRDSCLELMQKKGLWNIVGGKRELLESLVLVSLFASDFFPEAELADYLALEEIDWSTLWTELSACQQKTGLNLLRRSQGYVGSFV